ncbi:MAG: hypothetical protein KTR32_22070 [Granulosicoccus sp.]|nr:hypothetical protein [Granulosicoccus sp.]
MDIKLVSEIIACLPAGRTCFPYYRDRYAALLLPWVVEEGALLSSVKKSRFGSLLSRPSVKSALVHCGDGRFHREHFCAVWEEPHEQFLLTLDRWGGGHRAESQTSRPGHNLVLQVNLNEGYRQLFDRLVAEDLKYWFRSYGHPVMRERANGFHRQTLGWIRIDLDLQTGEAVIEEIQTDWMRDARFAASHSARYRQNRLLEYEQLEQYSRKILERLGGIWDEALLSAALWFLREEIGIKTVWYHTFESGSRLKRIKYRHPPRSLYSRLPRKFCFELSDEHPQFLSTSRAYRRLQRKHELHWFRLNLI